MSNIGYIFTQDDLLNATQIDIYGLEILITNSTITTGTFMYMDQVIPSVGQIKITLWFNNTLSTQDQTTLKTIINNYVYVSYDNNICIVQEVQSSGTNGGTFNENIWTKRQINEMVGNVTFASLDTTNNLITLQPGNYTLNLHAMACNVGNHLVRLLNVADNSYIRGLNAFSSGNQMTASNLIANITLDVVTTYRVEHICSKTSKNSGLGLATGFLENEIYTTMIITQN